MSWISRGESEQASGGRICQPSFVAQVAPRIRVDITRISSREAPLGSHTFLLFRMILPGVGCIGAGKIGFTFICVISTSALRAKYERHTLLNEQ